jgi:hypothetical protein
MRMAPEILPFLERMLLLLGQGNFTTTYKYAVLLALVDLCVEGAGRAPSTVTTPSPFGGLAEGRERVSRSRK